MRRHLFTLAATVSLVLCLTITALLIRSWFVSEHLAFATNSGPAWVVRTFHGRISFEHRSFWSAQGGLTWGRRRISFYDDPARYQYQEPTRAYGLMDAGFYSGTVYIWPGHLYPGVASPSNFSDPRYWRDNYRAVIVPNSLSIGLFAILPVIYVRRRFRKASPRPPLHDSLPGRVSTVLAAASLLVFLGLSELWPRTYCSGQMWTRGSGDRVAEVHLHRNQIHVILGSGKSQPPFVETNDAWTHLTYRGGGPPVFPWQSALEQWTGFAYHNQRHPRYPQVHYMAVPLWPLWALSTLLPLRWIHSYRRLRLRRLRLAYGRCEFCGYDLTGNTSDRCPECGSRFTQEMTTASKRHTVRDLPTKCFQPFVASVPHN